VGTPARTYNSRASIEQAYLSMDSALGSLPHTICYAVKANSNLGILRSSAPSAVVSTSFRRGTLPLAAIGGAGETGSSFLAWASRARIRKRCERAFLLFQRGISRRARPARPRKRRVTARGAAASIG